MAPSFDWWVKEKHIGTPVIVKMQNPNWSISELSSPENDEFAESRKDWKAKNAKQITWVLLLKAHRAADCLTYLASATARHSARHRFYTCIKIFLWLSILLLAFEIAAYLHGFKFPSSIGVRSLFGSIYASWLSFRAKYIAPLLQFLANACVVLFLVQSADRFILCVGWFWIRFKGIKPVAKAVADDLEAGKYFPMVLIQMPMCNEKEVYQQSIAAVCNLDWPKSNLLIQVLDDSDDSTTQVLIREEVKKWEQSGVQIIYRHRIIRDGYKAGNLKSAMHCSYVKDYEFVAIFDADFQPTPDFLKLTVPHFKGNEELALLQARWNSRLMVFSSTSLGSTGLLAFGELRHWRILEGGWRGPQLMIWTLQFEHISRVGSSSS